MEAVFPASYYDQEAVPSLAALFNNLNDLLERCRRSDEQRREVLTTFKRPMKRDDFDALLRQPVPDTKKAAAEYAELHATVGAVCQATERVLDQYHFDTQQAAYERTSMRTLANLKTPAEFEAMLHEYEARHHPRPPAGGGA
jgi:hypothetical protein